MAGQFESDELAMDFGKLYDRPVHAEIAGFAQYCLDLAGDRELPRRSDFDPCKVLPMLGNVYLLEVTPDGKDYYPSLFGVHMAVLYDSDLSQVPLNEFRNADLRDALRKTYDEVTASGKPLYMRGKYVWPDKSVGFERLLVPMAGDSAGVTAILGMTILDASDESLETFEGSVPATMVPEETLRCEIPEYAS